VLDFKVKISQMRAFMGVSKNLLFLNNAFLKYFRLAQKKKKNKPFELKFCATEVDDQKFSREPI